MNLYLLKRSEKGSVVNDHTRGFVVVAIGEMEARSFASGDDELNADMWLSKEGSTCEFIGTAVAIIKAGVILADTYIA